MDSPCGMNSRSLPCRRLHRLACLPPAGFIKSFRYKQALAEREGFEPSVRGYRTPDFESGTFDHSATSPECINQ